MTAWHNDPELKAQVLARMIAHRDEDSIVQGLYQKYAPELATGYKGCFIGCMLPKQPLGSSPNTGRRMLADEPLLGWHGEVERLYGIPYLVGHLLDGLFESQPPGFHAVFAVSSIEAIPVGADLSLVQSRLTLDVLTDPDRGTILMTVDGSGHREVVQAVINLHRRKINGDEPAGEEWQAAQEAATIVAGDDSAYTGAYAAAKAACAAAYGDAWQVASCSSYGADHSDWWTWVTEQLLHHLRNAPIPGSGQTP